VVERAPLGAAVDLVLLDDQTAVVADELLTVVDQVGRLAFRTAVFRFLFLLGFDIPLSLASRSCHYTYAVGTSNI